MTHPAPIGALVRLYYDGCQLVPGDVLVTRTGRRYQVTSVHVQRRGEHRGRQHLACLVVGEDALPRNVYPLRWYRRGRR